MNHLRSILYFLVLLSLLFSQELSYSIFATGFKKPLYLTHHVSDSSILFVLEQRGVIWSLNDGIREKKPFLDIRDRVHNPLFPGDEMGLLGAVFHPNFNDNGYLYLNYVDEDDNTIISRFKYVNKY